MPTEMRLISHPSRLATRNFPDSRFATRDSRPIVWIDHRYPVIAAGLEWTLRKEFRVYRGEEPPEERKPSFVVFIVDDAENLPEDVESVRKSNPDALVVVFGLSNDPSLARSALRSGARGYVHAEYTPEQIIRALNVVADGEIAAPRTLLEYLVAGMGDEGTVDTTTLSDRQREVLDLVGDGLSNAEISRELFLSESTVKQHLRLAYKALGVRNRAQATRRVRNGS